jgi:hypothetical protein
MLVTREQKAHRPARCIDHGPTGHRRVDRRRGSRTELPKSLKASSGTASVRRRVQQLRTVHSPAECTPAGQCITSSV